jgi:hypothetical protein
MSCWQLDRRCSSMSWRTRIAASSGVAAEGAAVQLSEDLPGLEGGDGAFAGGADPGVVAVRQWWSVAVAFKGVRRVPPASG